MKTLLPLAQDCAVMLKYKRWTVAVSESSSGGLISAALLAVPGASAYFLGGAVVYTGRARRELLQLPDDKMRAGSATEAYALLAAARIRKQLKATFAVAETGAAGPTDIPNHLEPGTTCLAVVGRQKRSRTVETGDIDRQANMHAFARAALELLRESIEAEGQGRMDLDWIRERWSWS